MKIGDIVSTPDGLGEIVIVEEIDHRERQLSMLSSTPPALTTRLRNTIGMN